MASEHSTKGDAARHVTRGADPSESAPARHPTDENPDPTPSLEWEQEDGRNDPAQRFALYRLCACEKCDGLGKDSPTRQRCSQCRGEGRTKELVATCGTPEGVGVALVTLGREGEWSDCPIGVLDRMGEKGQKWLVSPWERSPRNVSDAARTLRKQRYTS